MTTQSQDATVRTEVVVDVPIERAFAVFTEDFDSIKPREHNMLQVEIAETVFEAREGGRIYDRGVDGTECRWARVLAYEPPHRVVFSWTSARGGGSRRNERRRARSKCDSSPRRPIARGSSSSTAISTATDRIGRECERASTPKVAGLST